MEKGLQFEVVTPEKVVVSEVVEYVGAPGAEGDFGVLPNHVPLLSVLNTGNIMYRKGGLNHYVFVAMGLAEISLNKVTILAEISELARDIDKERAVSARDRANLALGQKLEGREHAEALQALQRAVGRIRTVEQAEASGSMKEKS